MILIIFLPLYFMNVLKRIIILSYHVHSFIGFIINANKIVIKYFNTKIHLNINDIDLNVDNSIIVTTMCKGYT